MAKVSIKSEKITPFGGIFHVREHLTGGCGFWGYHFAINTIYNTVCEYVNFSFEHCVKMVVQEPK